MNGGNGFDNFDGPTSAYVKRNRKNGFAYKFKKMLYERKKAEVEKSISFDDTNIPLTLLSGIRLCPLPTQTARVSRLSAAFAYWAHGCAGTGRKAHGR